MGFCNWTKAVIRFKEHQLSHALLVAVAAHISCQKPINQQLEKQITGAQQKQRHSFLKQLSALRYLLFQGLVIRNDHGGGSNLTLLLRLVLEEEKWVQDNRYHSPEVINELTEIMGHTVLRSILQNMFSQHWFALLADETRDVSNLEQLVLGISWVSDSYEINEDMVGLIQLNDTTAANIYKCLKDSLVSLGFQFDGASSFRGHVSGVRRRFQDDNPAAGPVHCLAHCVNLCACKKWLAKFTVSRKGLILPRMSYSSSNYPQNTKLFLKAYKNSKIHPILPSIHYAPHDGPCVLEPGKLL